VNEGILILTKPFFLLTKERKVLIRKIRIFASNVCYIVKNQFFVKSFVHQLDQFIRKLNPFEFFISDDPAPSNLAHRQVPPKKDVSGK